MFEIKEHKYRSFFKLAPVSLALGRRESILAFIDGLDKTTKILDLKDFSIKRSLFFDDEGTSKILFCFDDTKIATGSYNGLIKICDVETGEVYRLFEGKKGSIKDIALYRDKLIVGVGNKDRINIWDIESQSIVAEFRSEAEYVRSVCFNQNGTVVAAVDDSGRIRVFDVQNCSEIFSIRINPDSCSEIRFCNNDSFLVISGFNGELSLIDIKRRNLDKVFFIGHQSVTFALFKYNGLLLSNSQVDDFPVQLWDVNLGKKIFDFPGQTFEVECLDYSPNLQMIAASGTNKQFAIEIWKLSSDS